MVILTWKSSHQEIKGSKKVQREKALDIIRRISLFIFLAGFAGSFYAVFNGRYSGDQLVQVGLFEKNSSVKNALITRQFRLSQGENPYRLWIKTTEKGLGGLTEFSLQVKLIGQKNNTVFEKHKTFSYLYDRQRTSLPWRKESKYEVGLFDVQKDGQYRVRTILDDKVYQLFSKTSEKLDVIIDCNAKQIDMSTFMIFLPMLILGAVGAAFTRKDNLKRFGLIKSIP